MNGRNIVSRNQSNPRFTVRLGKSYQRNLSPCASAPAMWCGKIKKHSTKEAIKTAITVKGISLIKSPNRPPIATRPKNAMTVVTVALNTGDAIRRAAFSAATIGASPSRRALKSACSPTTIASSTTIPSVMISAKRLIMLIVKPAAYMMAIAESMATGMPAATQNAVRAFRNKNSSNTTRPKPVRPFSIRILRRPLMASARVRINSTLTPAGRLSDISSATLWTCSWMLIASP